MIKFLYDETTKSTLPFYDPEIISKLLDLNWNSGEKELANFCEELVNSLGVSDQIRYSSEIRYVLNKKLRTSREILAAHKLNTKLNHQLEIEIGEPCFIMVNALDHGVDAVVVNKNYEILKYLELKSTKAALGRAKRKNFRGDVAGERTAYYGSTFKFHLNKTDDHARNYLNLLKNLRKPDVAVFLYTMCFEQGINGVVDGFFLTGKNAAKILDQLGGSTSLKQINPTACYGKYKQCISFFYTKDLNKIR